MRGSHAFQEVSAMSHVAGHSAVAFAEDVDTLRHSTAHVMAKAVQRLFPGTRLAIGPTIENGFYYDLDVPRTLSTEDLAQVEAEMRRIVEADEPFARSEMPRQEAIEFFRRNGEPYKVEVLERIEDDVVSLYRTGDDWIDLCRGPHVPSAGRITAFKLLNVAGAYWRGDEKRPMLQRVYGTAWHSQEELDHYLWQVEEARKRDHRKLGRELDLFSFSDLAPGEVFWHPKGMRLVRTLEALSRAEHDRRGYQEISTPLLVKKGLWEQSGHWGYYRDNMFRSMVEDEEYAFKPMNCPEATIVYRQRTRSYRDLPIRLAEIGRLLRFEKSGTLSGLLRVRQLTMDDAHIFCRPDQILEEISGVLEMGRFFYDLFGFQRRYYLSTRPEKAMGDPALWQQAEEMLAKALEQNEIAYEVKPGEGAFYGPKIDIDINDALGRAWQLTTIQLDFNLPERFELEYVGEDSQPHRPVMIHRAIYGTYERFIAILIEHYGGAFPLWLAPIQAVVIPIADRHLPYAESVAARLRGAGFRTEVDARRERMNYKIHEAQEQKIPYMLVVGDKEAAAESAALRERQEGDLGPLPIDEIVLRMGERVAAWK
jgi:threonyl-tRNA synthetase